MSELDEQLRARLAGIDPMPTGSPVDPVTSPRAHELLERIMLSTPVAAEPAPSTPTPWWQRPALVAAAASLVVVAGVGTALTLDGSSPEPAPTSVTLAAPDSNAMSSCMVFDVAILRTMPVALSGSVSAIEADAVILDVDRWYAGGSADQVRLTTSGVSPALDGGPAFEVGQRYLISASEGVVSSCGYSGAYSEQLAESYREAFPG